METATPATDAFMQRNGSDLSAYGNGQYDENEDFGPETDVDMVDDVLLSPAIAAAKALVSGKDLDDVERQRQQLLDFDDPEDRSRDTPTPPAHEGGNANADPLGDSGEESEEEWNYIPGKENNPAKPDSQTQDEDDMSSQLNPNAAEFVPVSPTRLLMLDDAIISASSYHHNESLDEVKIPSEHDFDQEIAQRPSELEYSNGFNHGDDYFMRDNFSTLRNKAKDINVSSTCAELGDSSILSFNSSFNNSASEVTPFDKMEDVQNMASNKENLFPANIDFNSDVFATFGKGDPMTTSIIGLGSSSDVEENLIPGTPKSTDVEAPVSPSNDDVSPLNHHVELSDDEEAVKSPTFNEQTQEVSNLKKSESSEFECESRAAEGELHPQDDNEGFITEHRRSPPIDLSFKPIQNFSDTNPFGPLQTPVTATPLDQPEIVSGSTEIHSPFASRFDAKDTDNNASGHRDFLQSTPTSFISVRSPGEVPVPFDDLESPKEALQFNPPPNVSSDLLETEVPQSSEPLAVPLVSENEVHQEETIVEPITEEPTVVENNILAGDSTFYTTADFHAEESKILQDELECEQHSKLEDEPDRSETQQTELISPVDSAPKILTAFEDIKTVVDSELESHPNKLDIEVETKEMNLEFESHIAPSDVTPEELKNLDEGFEVISKDELTTANDATSPLLSPSKQTNPFISEDDLSDIPIAEEKSQEPVAKKDFLSAIESFSSAITEDFVEQEQKSPLLSALDDFAPEPVATKTVTYQTLTPAEEPQLCKSTAYVTGIDEISAEKSQTVEETPVSIIEETPVPIIEETPKQIVEEKPVPVVEETPAPIVEETPLPIVEETPKPIVEETPKPIVEETPAPIVEESPAPIVEEKPVPKVEEPLVESTPAESIVQETPVVDVLAKSEPVESQVVTETLIAALEEKSEVMAVTTAEATPSAGTPPPTPTPAPGLEDKDTQKTDILVAAVAAAGAVAAGTAAKVVEKEVKKTTATAAKKPAVSAAKKPAETTKAPAKPAPAKAPAAKPAPTKPTTTAKPASATKPTGTTAAAKPAAAKPASAPAGVKKPTTAAPAKPAAAAKPTSATAKPAAKPASATAAPKPTSTTAAKQVPNKLAVSKTTMNPLKPSSKPSTPTSKPTTPTTPKSPSVKSDAVKSPPRPAVRSTLTKPAADKKPLTNGDVKPTAAKKPEDAKKPLAASKPAAPARSAVSSTKPAVTSTKPATTAAALKSAPAKPSATAAPKTKPAAPAAAAPVKPPPIKRPTSAAAPKPADKPVKETGKPLANAKPAVNGKAAPAKPAGGVKKTDAKVNGKSSPAKPVPAKKIEDVKKEEETEAIQEANVTTTNGFVDHNEHEVNGISEIENVAPVLVDGVN